jgi:hypothetical protein
MPKRFPGKKLSQYYGEGGDSGSTIFKGEITQPSDFPMLLEVQPGWEYIINNPAGVTDNDVTKTNTGLSFNDGDFIIWTGSTWVVENAVDTYQNAAPTTFASGGIPAGSTFFATPKTFSQTAAQQFHGYLTPAFASFSLQNQTIRELGNALTTVEDFIWTFTNGGNVADNAIEIYDMVLAQQIIAAHSKTSPASFDFSTLNGGAGIVRNTIGTYQFKINAQNTQSGGLTRNFDQNWYMPQWSGASIKDSGLTDAEIRALGNKYVVNTPPTSFPFVGGNLYSWYWILSSFAQPVRFRNLGTGFEIGFVGIDTPITQTVANAYGINTYTYRGYHSTQLLENAINIGVEFA